MLILKRRPGEMVMIGEEVTCTVLAVKGNNVRFGFEAPRDVDIHREEIYERIKRQVLGQPGDPSEDLALNSCAKKDDTDGQ